MLPARHAYTSLSVKIEGLPPGASLTKGRNNGDRTWTVDPDDVDGLAYRPASADFAPHRLAIRILGFDDDIAATISVVEVEMAPGAPPPTLPRHPSYDEEVAEEDAEGAPPRRRKPGQVDADKLVARLRPKIEARVEAAGAELRAGVAVELDERLAALQATMLETVEQRFAALARDAQAGKGDAKRGAAGGIRQADVVWQLEQVEKALRETLDARIAEVTKAVAEAKEAGAAALRASRGQGPGPQPQAPPPLDLDALKAELASEVSARLDERVATLRGSLLETLEKRLAALPREAPAGKGDAKRGAAGGVRQADVAWQLEQVEKGLRETLDGRIAEVTKAVKEAKEAGDAALRAAKGQRAGSQPQAAPSLDVEALKAEISSELSARLGERVEALGGGAAADVERRIAEAAADAERRIADRLKAAEAEPARRPRADAQTPGRVGQVRQADLDWQLSNLRKEMLAEIERHAKAGPAAAGDGSRPRSGTAAPKQAGEEAGASLDAVAARIESQLESRLAARLDNAKAEAAAAAERRIAELRTEIEEAAAARVREAAPPPAAAEGPDPRIAQLAEQVDALKTELLGQIETRVAAVSGIAEEAKEAGRTALSRTDAIGTATEESLQARTEGFLASATELEERLRAEIGSGVAEAKAAAEAALETRVEGAEAAARTALDTRLGEASARLDGLREELLGAIEAARAAAQGKADETSARIDALDRGRGELADALARLEAGLAEARAAAEAASGSAEAALSLGSDIETAIGALESRLGDELAARIAEAKSEADSQAERRVGEAQTALRDELTKRLEERLGQLEERLGGRIAEADTRLTEAFGARLEETRSTLREESEAHAAEMRARLSELRDVAAEAIKEAKESVFAEAREEMLRAGEQAIAAEMPVWRKQLEERSRDIERSASELARQRVAEIRRLWDSDKRLLITEACREFFSDLQARDEADRPEWLREIEAALAARFASRDAELAERLDSFGKRWGEQAKEWLDGLRREQQTTIDRRLREAEDRLRTAQQSTAQTAAAPAAQTVPVGAAMGRRIKWQRVRKSAASGSGRQRSGRTLYRLGMIGGLVAVFAAGATGFPQGAFERVRPYLAGIAARLQSAAAPPAGPPAQEAAAQPAVVDTPIANLRAGPSTTFPVVATVTRGETVDAVGRDGEWVRVQTRRVPRGEGWIHSSLLKIEPPG